MNQTLENIIKGLFRAVKLGIRRRAGAILITKENDKFRWLKDLNIKTIIDVGAHTGETAREFHKVFPKAKIYSFEPLRDCFERLNANLKNINNFQSFNFALGDRKEKGNIYRTELSNFSSLLKSKQMSKELLPGLKCEKTESCDVKPLDAVMQSLDVEDDILLKVDVQGYEDKVLKGAKNILKRVKAIIVETSFLELYEKQALFHDIYLLLIEEGFRYAGALYNLDLNSPKDGTPLQQDSIFIRKA